MAPESTSPDRDDSGKGPDPFAGMARPGDTGPETLTGASSESTVPGTSSPSAPGGPLPGDGPTQVITDPQAPQSEPTGTTPLGVAGEGRTVHSAVDRADPGPASDTTETQIGPEGEPVAERGEIDSPLKVEKTREGDEAEIGTAEVKAGDVPEGAQVLGHNPADGAPIVVDPRYRGSGDHTADNRAVQRAVMADEDASEAERGTGERTVTAREPGDIIDGRHVGMNPAVEYRPRNGLRVLVMDRPFHAGGRDGGAGDYLAELYDGTRVVMTQAELDEHFVPVG